MTQKTTPNTNNIPKEETGVQAPPAEQGSGLFDREALAATRVRYITPENAVFRNGEGCLFLRDPATGDEQRVILHLLFPYTTCRKLVSVLNPEQEEVGMIRDIDAFSGESLEAIEKEIARRHFVRTITKILKIKDKNGITTWTVETDGGANAEFALKDTYGSIFHVTETRLLITDIDGNRFEIANAEELDKGSRRKIELYL
ncbi:MAG: DUF1854 domain-containing protein [Clostridia bacterium]|nr:DUF1854 domain-containing protein [Clostridia bacterium]